MRTTLNIDDSLLRHAAKLTGVKEKTSLVRLGLEALISKESARRLAELGGTERRLRSIRRRKGEDKRSNLSLWRSQDNGDRLEYGFR